MPNPSGLSRYPNMRAAEAAAATGVSVTLTVSPAPPAVAAVGTVVTAAYTVAGAASGSAQTLAFSGSATLNGVSFPGVTGSFSLPGGTPAETFAVPTCPGLTFSATANPAVFAATVPAADAASGAQTVSGSATVSGTGFPVAAGVTLPSSPSGAACLLGAYSTANNAPSSWADMQAFQTAGAPLRVGTYYMQFPQGSQASNWPANFAGLCKANGVTPFVEMEPWYTTSSWPAFTSIAAGAFDAYLQAVATSARAFGAPVYMTYAHEQNGSWYPWGSGGAEKVTPAQWVASWQHVVSVMSAIAPNIEWVWAPNNADVGGVEPFYPGDAYVSVAGWDAYLQNASQTYSNFLAQTVTQIKALTGKPIWLAETGIAPSGSTRAARITGLMQDLKAAGVSGAMWFSQGTYALTAAEISTLAAAANAWNAA